MTTEQRSRPGQQLRERLAERGHLAGVFQASGSSLNGEIMALADADFNVIDLEHGAGSYASLLDEIRAIEAAGGIAQVRVPANEAIPIGRALDFGAAGVMIPQVNSRAEAEFAVQRVTYPPKGRRGVTTAGRTYGFGSFAGGLQDADEDQPFLMCQIESRQAVEDIEAIAATPGVDVLLIGPADLSADLGLYGQPEHPEFIDACQRVADAASQAGIAAGFVSLAPAQQERLAELGFTVFLVGSDTRWLLDGARNGVSAGRAAIERGRATR